MVAGVATATIAVTTITDEAMLVGITAAFAEAAAIQVGLSLSRP